MQGHRPRQKTKQTPYGRGTGVPNPIDVHVGGRIRTQRLFLGVTQQMLANQLGLTFQQVQKYERGSNRVSASMLAAIADVLQVPISHFFRGYVADESTLSAEERRLRDILQRPETLDLVRHYSSIDDTRVRRQFLELVKAVAARPLR